MEKRISILLALVVCLMLTACTPEGPGNSTQSGTEGTQGFFDGDMRTTGIYSGRESLFRRQKTTSSARFLEGNTSIITICRPESPACSARTRPAPIIRVPAAPSWASVPQRPTTMGSSTGWEGTRQGPDMTNICGAATSPGPIGRS